MSFRAVIYRLLQNGRYIFRDLRLRIQPVVEGQVLQKGGDLTAAATLQSVQHVPLHVRFRKLFLEGLLRRVTTTQSSHLRQRVVKQLLYGNSRPFFSLVGVSLASGTGLLQRRDDCEGVCSEIRDAVSKLPYHREKFADESNENETEPISLANLELGPAIAKGCSAVVYAARFKDDVDTKQYPLAVKMMFNYDAESNALTIFRSMYRETVPAQFITMDIIEEWKQSTFGRLKSLPQHPNVVDLKYVFADQIPDMSDSMALYPDALPRRLNPNGSGRNMSLFLIMKRYDSSLHDYLKKTRSYKTSLLLLTQLLEGVVHLNHNEIAHRDLKSDNVLLDLSNGEDNPLLAITDFGCCLADNRHGLFLPYNSPETDKGGNPALMAPEVACATPGPFTRINYAKSDVWTVGTLIYELFGVPNPFYQDQQGKRLDSRKYKESDLPPLPDEVSPWVQSLLCDMLRRNASQRLSAEMAATICQLFLWAPTSWLGQDYNTNPSNSEVLQWLLCLTTKVMYEDAKKLTANINEKAVAEYQLVSTFLARARVPVIQEALAWIHEL